MESDPGQHGKCAAPPVTRGASIDVVLQELQKTGRSSSPPFRAAVTIRMLSIGLAALRCCSVVKGKASTRASSRQPMSGDDSDGGAGRVVECGSICRDHDLRCRRIAR
jgi:hypothetical protein